MLDFSNDIIAGTVDIRALTAAEDQELFSNIRSGEVRVSLNVIDAPNANDIIVPVEKDGQKFELAFVGARADLYSQTVLAHLASVAAFAESNDVALDITAHGTWTKRHWTGRNGQKMTTLRLNVAQWDYDTGFGPQTAGHLPA
jgi:hypothetical protein